MWFANILSDLIFFCMFFKFETCNFFVAFSHSEECNKMFHGLLTGCALLHFMCYFLQLSRSPSSLFSKTEFQRCVAMRNSLPAKHQLFHTFPVGPYIKLMLPNFKSSSILIWFLQILRWTQWTFARTLVREGPWFCCDYSSEYILSCVKFLLFLFLFLFHFGCHFSCMYLDLFCNFSAAEFEHIYWLDYLERAVMISFT